MTTNWVNTRLPATPEEFDEARDYLYGQIENVWSTPGLMAKTKAHLDVLDNIRLSNSIDNMRLTVTMQGGKLGSLISDFTERTEATGNRLANWTAALAVATFLLAGATVGLVIVEALKRR